MLVRVIKPWRQFRAGRVLNMPDGAANVRIRRGMVEPAEQESEEPPRNQKRPKSRHVNR